MNPLDASDLALADQIITSTDQLLDYYGKCTDCGLDVAAMAEQAKAMNDFGRKVKQHFSGGLPGESI